MKYIPILFSTAMVQALLDKRKTMTRRIVKSIEITENEGKFNFQSKKAWGQNVSKENLTDSFLGFGSECPYGKPGDVLWVRETFSVEHIENGKHTGFQYKADDLIRNIRWKPSLFMPKEACRIFLEITNIRVERLQDISEEDAMDEGTGVMLYRNEFWEGDKDCYRKLFKLLWQSINGADSWNKNPWVWVVEFKQVERPEGFLQL